MGLQGSLFLLCLAPSGAFCFFTLALMDNGRGSLNGSSLFNGALGLVVGLLVGWFVRGRSSALSRGSDVEPQSPLSANRTAETQALKQRAAAEVALLLLAQPFLGSWRSTATEPANSGGKDAGGSTSVSPGGEDTKLQGVLKLAEILMPYYQCSLYVAEFERLYGPEVAANARRSLAVRIEVLV